MNTYKVIDIQTNASAHVEAKTPEDAARSCGFQQQDIGRRVRVKKIGAGPRYRHFGKRQETGYAALD